MDFNKLYEENYSKVYNLAYFTTKNKELAEDLTADAFVSAYQNLDALEDESKFSAWVSKIVSNKCKDYFKKNKPTLFTELSGENDEGEDLEIDFEDNRENYSPTKQSETKETMATVENMLYNLPEDQRLCLLMFCGQEMKISEIAETLGISENTVKSKINYARKKMNAQKDEYEKDGNKLYGLAGIGMLPIVRNMLKSNTAVPKVESVLSKAKFDLLGNSSTINATGNNYQPSNTYFDSLNKTGNVQGGGKIMFCEKCGAMLPEIGIFCPCCGAKSLRSQGNFAPQNNTVSSPNPVNTSGVINGNGTGGVPITNMATSAVNGAVPVALAKAPAKIPLLKSLIAIILAALTITGGYFGVTQLTKSGPEKLIDKFEKAYNNNDVSEMVECLDPDTQANYKLGYGIFNTVGSIFGLGSISDELLDGLWGTKISEGPIDLDVTNEEYIDDNHAIITVTEKNSGEEEKISIIKISDEWYIDCSSEMEDIE